MKIEGKVAFVTGGASGLGYAAVWSLVENGAKVGVADLNEEKGKEIENKFGQDRVVFIETDVTDPDQVKNAIETTYNKFGALHITINWAGIGIPSQTLNKNAILNLKRHKMIMDINVNGTVYSSAYSALYMSKNKPENERGERGVIIHIASSLGTQGPRGFASYSASKGAILGLTLPMARDLGKYGIRVFNIAPSLFRTPMTESPDDLLIKMAATSGPLNRVGEVDEFAHLVIASIENSYINGVSLLLTGGTIATNG